MVSAAFILHNNQILLFHRDNIPTIKDPDCWDIIGGHADPGESPEQTLKREVQEEIGLDDITPVFLQNLEDSWGSETNLFTIRLNDEQVKYLKLGDEGQEIKFFNLNDLKNVKLTQNIQKYLNDFKMEFLIDTSHLE